MTERRFINPNDSTDDNSYNPAAAMAGLACKLMRAAPNLIGTDQGDVDNCDWAAYILKEHKLLVSALQSHIHELKCKKESIFVGAQITSRDEATSKGALITMNYHASVCKDLIKCEELIVKLSYE